MNTFYNTITNKWILCVCPPKNESQWGRLENLLFVVWCTLPRPRKDAYTRTQIPGLLLWGEVIFLLCVVLLLVLFAQLVQAERLVHKPIQLLLQGADLCVSALVKEI